MTEILSEIKNNCKVNKKLFLSLPWYEKFFFSILLFFIAILTLMIHEFLFVVVLNKYFILTGFFSAWMTIQTMISAITIYYYNSLSHDEKLLFKNILNMSYKKTLVLVMIIVFYFMYSMTSYFNSEVSMTSFILSLILSFVLHYVIIFLIMYYTIFFSLEILTLLDCLKHEKTELDNEIE